MTDASQVSTTTVDGSYRCTFGVFDQVGPWSDVRNLSWHALASILTTHGVGQKKGTCIVPAIFTGAKRHKSEASIIDVVFLDSDSGIPFEEISIAIAARGWRAIIASTHSHGMTRTVARRSAWEKHHTGFVSSDAPADFLINVKRLDTRVAAGACLIGETATEVTFQHLPCPKFRVAIALARPWIAANYRSQAEATNHWRERVEAVAAVLGLPHDQSCTDASRAFFLPRRPADGPAPQTAILEGEPCDIFDLPKSSPFKAAAKLDGLTLIKQPLESGGKPKFEFVDQIKGDSIDLELWAGRYAKRFEIAKALDARFPNAFTPVNGENTKRHIVCVNEDAHTQADAGGSTYISNASESPHGSFVYHCRHGHCTGPDRLQFVSQMLERGWLEIADLTDPTFLAADRHSASSNGDHGKLSLEVGSDIEIARRVLADLRQELANVVQDEGSFWSYNGRLWERILDYALWQRVFRFDGALFRTPSHKIGSVQLGEGRVRSVLACLQRLTHNERFFATAPAGINCLSGFITFNRLGIPSLAPHQPDHRQRHMLPGRWPIRSTQSPPQGSVLAKFLIGCFKEDVDCDDKIDLLAEALGVAAAGIAARITQPKAIVLVGKQAENGKSQVLSMFRSLLATTAVSAISPSRFNDMTFACRLAGMLLNAPDELGSLDSISSGMFKQIITGEPIMVRDVYSSAVQFNPMAQHVFATNHLPTFKGGMDRGVRRRLMPLVFNRVIPKDERIEQIGQRIGEEEPDILLDWAVRGAQRVVQNGSFTEPASSRAALQEWMYSSDPVLAWLESDQVTYRRGDYVPEIGVSHAYAIFKTWALSEGFEQDRLPALNGFSQHVEAARNDVARRRTKSGARFVGLGCAEVDEARAPGDAK